MPFLVWFSGIQSHLPLHPAPTPSSSTLVQKALSQTSFPTLSLALNPDDTDLHHQIQVSPSCLGAPLCRLSISASASCCQAPSPGARPRWHPAALSFLPCFLHPCCTHTSEMRTRTAGTSCLCHCICSNSQFLTALYLVQMRPA